MINLPGEISDCLELHGYRGFYELLHSFFLVVSVIKMEFKKYNLLQTKIYKTEKGQQ